MRRNLYRNFRRKCICVSLGCFPMIFNSISSDLASYFDKETEDFNEGLPHFIGFICLFIIAFIDVFFNTELTSEDFIKWATDGIKNLTDEEKLLILKTAMLGRLWQDPYIYARLKQEKQRLQEQILIKKLAGI